MNGLQHHYAVAHYEAHMIKIEDWVITGSTSRNFTNYYIVI